MMVMRVPHQTRDLPIQLSFALRMGLHHRHHRCRRCLLACLSDHRPSRLPCVRLAPCAGQTQLEAMGSPQWQHPLEDGRKGYWRLWDLLLLLLLKMTVQFALLHPSDEKDLC